MAVYTLPDLPYDHSALEPAISAAIIELHHGEIIAESDGPGRGARFIVTLPAVEKPQTQTSHASAHV